MAEPATVRVADSVPPHLRERLEAIRAELRRMDYRRLTDAEMEQLLDLDVDAKANNAVEGLYADAAEDAFFEMMNEERVPQEIRAQFVIRFVTGSQMEPLE
jgi:hypothetical protein